MTGSYIQDLQVVSVWLCICLSVCIAIATSNWRSWRSSTNRLPIFAYSAIALIALTTRLLVSPRTLIHENSHGYEYIKSAFTLEGFFWHGSAYYATFHPVSQIFGQHHSTVFYGNALASSLTAVLLGVCASRLCGSAHTGYLAALLWALLPTSLRISCSESMFPLAILFLSSALVASLDVTHPNRTSRHVLFFLLLSCSIQTRPSLFFLATGIILAHCITAYRNRDEAHPPLLIGLSAFVVVSLPWLAFRISDISTNGIPSFTQSMDVSIFSLSFSGLAASTGPKWVPLWLLLLSLAGAISLAVRKPVATFFLAMSLVLHVVATADAATSSEAAAVRVHSPSHAFLVVLAASFLSFFPPRRRFAYRLIVPVGVVLIAVTSLVQRLDLVRREHMPQEEFRFLAQIADTVPRECTILTAPRFLADGVISSEFPDWLYSSSIHTAEGPLSQGDRPESRCYLYYQGLACQLYTAQELALPSAVPSPSLRPDCQIEGLQLGVFHSSTELVSSMDVEWLSPRTANVTIGFRHVTLK